MAYFPRMKWRPRKLPVVLSHEEVERLLDQPDTETILGLRDRAMLSLLYGTGIRASECAGVLEEDVDLDGETIRVTGKGLPNLRNGRHGDLAEAAQVVGDDEDPQGHGHHVEAGGDALAQDGA